MKNYLILKFKNKKDLQKIDDITYAYFNEQQGSKLFDTDMGQLRLFNEGLDKKNWQEVAAELYAKDNPWLFKNITNQNRSDFLFLLDIKKDMLALEIGAGWGQVAIPLSQFCNVVTIDSNPEKIQIMKKIAKQENKNNMQFVVSDISDKIFEHNQFDLIIFNSIPEWLEHSRNTDPTTLLNDALCEAHNLLKPEGVLYIGIENKYGLKYLLGEKNDHTDLSDHVYLKKEIAKSIFEAETDKKLKVLTYSKQEYEEMLMHAGFKDIKFFGDLPDYKFLHTVVDLSSGHAPSFVAKNLDFVPEYDWVRGNVSKYNEKLKNLYEIFSGEELINLYPAYSILSKK